MIQITQTTDLLLAKPINEQILIHGRNDVNIEIGKYVTKCARGLGVELSNESLQILIEDIIEVYKWDAIEDIQVCLKNGRQGKYGPTYNKLNMIIIQEWMSKHLEQKAIARENQYKTRRHDFETREEYLKAVEIGLKRDAEDKKRRKEIEKEIHDNNNEFAKFKAEYEKNKKPEGTIQLKNN